MIDRETLEEAKIRYDAERYDVMTPNPVLREMINNAACHDVALTFGIDAEELADYIGEVTGCRPDPSDERPLPPGIANRSY